MFHSFSLPTSSETCPRTVLKDCFKNGSLSFATTWIDVRAILLCEINQTEKNKYYMISFVRGI